MPRDTGGTGHGDDAEGGGDSGANDEDVTGGEMDSGEAARHTADTPPGETRGTSGRDAGIEGDESAERLAEARDSGTDVDSEAAYDAEEPQAEWHVWLAAIVAMVGVAILIAPTDWLPELVVTLGPILVIIAVMAFGGQWLYRRYR